MNKKTNSRASFTTKAYLGEEKKQTYMYVHTSYISENNMSKILSLTISIFTWCAWCSLICVTKILNASEADLVTPFEVRLWLNRHTTGFGKAHKMHLYLHKIHVTIRNEILRNHEMSRIPALQVMVDFLTHGCWVSKDCCWMTYLKETLLAKKSTLIWCSTPSSWCHKRLGILTMIMLFSEI